MKWNLKHLFLKIFNESIFYGKENKLFFFSFFLLGKIHFEKLKCWN